MLIKKIGFICTLLLLMSTLTGCHQRVEPVSGMDRQLSCSELKKEIKNVEDVKKTIASNRGISVRNFFGLLFWPSILVNEVTGEVAEKEAVTRLVELKNIYASKQCFSDDCLKSQNG